MGRYKSFAYIGDRQGQEWSKRRESAFANAIAMKTGKEVRIYAETLASETEDRQRLARFLSELEYQCATTAASTVQSAPLRKKKS